MKNAVTCPISIKVIEVWLNDTLREAEFCGVPGSFKVNKANGDTVAMQDYSIDRITLGNSGISEATIDNLYRSLFVYTVGFYNKIKEIV